MEVKLKNLSKYFLFTTLLRDNSTGLVGGVGMICKLRWTCGNRTVEDDLLQIIKHWAVVFCKEGDSNTSFTRPASSSYTMSVVFNRFRHIIIDNHRNIFDIDTCSKKKVLKLELEV